MAYKGIITKIKKMDNKFANFCLQHFLHFLMKQKETASRSEKY